jgi:predicted CXXCH cytochrome family protein
MNKKIFVLLKLSVIALIVLAAWAAPVPVALADNGPHGGYLKTMDTCADCHRTNTTIGGGAFVSAAPGLCLTCHGSAGAGADTNVEDGVYRDGDSESESSPEGVIGRGLRGGGFVQATMDTNVDGVASTLAVTSRHLSDSASIGWEGSTIGKMPDICNSAMSCITCHDPHGRAGAGSTPTYRLLRRVPTEGNTAGINVPDEATKNYTVASGNNQYYGEDYGNQGQELSKWCSQCHAQYLAPVGSGSTPSGDHIFNYRHAMIGAGVSCMSCHVAHGTTVTMGTYSSGSSVDSRGNSVLLRVDNYGVCELCHSK